MERAESSNFFIFFFKAGMFRVLRFSLAFFPLSFLKKSIVTGWSAIWDTSVLLGAWCVTPFCITSLFKYRRLFLWQNCGLGGALLQTSKGARNKEAVCRMLIGGPHTHSCRSVPFYPAKKKSWSSCSSRVQISRTGLHSVLQKFFFFT